MTIGTRLLLTLAGLLAIAGVASAQCPECDPDGEPGDDGSYSSIDLGAVDEHGAAVGDTDLSVADEGSDSFWAWISICLMAFIEGIEDAIGIDLGLYASADAYVSEDGIDLDAGLTVPDAACGAANDALGQAPALPAAPALPVDASQVPVDTTVAGAPALPAAPSVPSEVPCSVDFDDSEVGGLDDATWDAMADAHANGAPYVGMPLGNEHLDGHDHDLCVGLELAIATCPEL